MTFEIFSLLWLAFFVGLLCGYGMWEWLHRAERAAYRALYKLHSERSHEP